MVSETPQVLEVCCCGQCAEKGHPRQTYRDMTAAELAQRDQDAARAAEEEAAREAEEAQREADRAEGVAALTALGLTEAQIEALLSR